MDDDGATAVVRQSTQGKMYFLYCWLNIGLEARQGGGKEIVTPVGPTVRSLAPLVSSFGLLRKKIHEQIFDVDDA